jgi:RNA polymerase sigma factor for flagellar operon FliA
VENRMNRRARNDMVVTNLPLVGYLVAKVCAGATHLSRDDLAQAGSIALVKAVDAWDPDRGIPFGAYARERIVGAIKDEMRASDWASRGVRTTVKNTLAVQDFLTAELGRTPTVDELAGALGVDRETAADGLNLAARTISTLDGTTAVNLAADIVLTEDSVVHAERMAYLSAAVNALPERMRLIVTMIYLNDRTVGDVAQELGVTHSAVSQQRAEAIRLLRDGLKLHYSDSDSETVGERSSAPGGRQTKYLATLGDMVKTPPLTMAALFRT